MSVNKSPPRPLRHDDVIIPPRQRKTVFTLLPSDCRWPIGDPQHGDFHFCGKEKVARHPYCAFHMRLAFQPTRPFRGGLYRPRAVA